MIKTARKSFQSISPTSIKRTERITALGTALAKDHPAIRRQIVPKRERTRLSFVKRAHHAQNLEGFFKEKGPSFFMMTQANTATLTSYVRIDKNILFSHFFAR